MCAAPSILKSSLSLVPVALAMASSLMARLSAFVAAIISKGGWISSIWFAASKRMKSGRLLVVHLNVESGSAGDARCVRWRTRYSVSSGGVDHEPPERRGPR